MNKFSSKKSQPYQTAAVSITAVLARDYGSAFWVGGTVRDMMLGRTASDIDIATAATPVQIKKVLKGMELPIISIGEKFGTIATLVEGHTIEITTYRIEDSYADSRHPDSVTFVKNVEEDAKRRDFTVNALYWDPQSGEIFDYHNGLKDLEAKKLRFIGNPSERIIEDPLRMLRAVRFAMALGFTLDATAKKAISENASRIHSVAAERITAELDMIIAHENYHAGFSMLDNLGVLAILFPELERLKTVAQSSNYHAEGNVFIHTMKVFANVSGSWKKSKGPADEGEIIFRYATLFHDLGKWGTATPTHREGRKHISFPQHGPIGSEIFLEIAKRLKFSADRRERIGSIISHHMDLRHAHDIGDATMIAWMERPFVLDLIRLRYADDGGAIRTDASGTVIPNDFSQLQAFEKRFISMQKRYVKEFISGEDVMRVCGVTQGAQVGTILTEIRQRQATSDISDRQEALDALKEIKKRKNS